MEETGLPGVKPPRTRPPSSTCIAEHTQRRLGNHMRLEDWGPRDTVGDLSRADSAGSLERRKDQPLPSPALDTSGRRKSCLHRLLIVGALLEDLNQRWLFFFRILDSHCFGNAMHT